MAQVAAKQNANVPSKSTNVSHVAAKLPTKLRKIGVDETFSASIKHLEPGRVEARFAVRPDEKTDDRYEVISVYDFRATSPAETQALAMRACVIETQRKWRTAAKVNLANAMNAAQWSAVNVKTDVVDAARKSANPVVKAKLAIIKSGLTKAELLAMLQAMPE